MEAQTHPLEHTQHEHKEHAHQECGCGCGCGCCELHIGEDVDEEEERRERRRTVLRLSIGAALLIAGWFTPPFWPQLLVYAAALLVTGGEVLWHAVSHIGKGQLFDENLLMSIAAVGAFAIGEYPEAVAVMLFYGIGEFFQEQAANRSRRSIAGLMELRPDSVELLLADGRTKTVSPELVRPGHHVLVKPGQRVPLDGKVLAGSSALDTAALTGESLPQTVTVGDDILSGCVALDGALTVEVTRPFRESTVSRILRLVEEANERKSRSEAFIRKFARIYTPVVVALAALVALLPPLLVPGQTFGVWLYRGLVFLVVSCPCALVLSVPLSFFAGLGAASRRGVLIKGGNFIETLAKTDTVVFDKTGTLTKGVFAVSRVIPMADMSEEEILYHAAAAESFSLHPLAAALRKAVTLPQDPALSEMKETAGRGVSALVDGRRVLAGSPAFLAENGITVPPKAAAGTTVQLAVDGVYQGYVRLADQLKEDAETALADLKKLGVKKLVLLTGDNETAATEIKERFALDEAYASLLPDGKVAQVEKLLAEKSAGSGKLLFVGDGINDAPVLARADAGVAMGAMGADAAIEAADVVIMDDRLTPLAEAIRLARRTMRIVRENIVFCLGVKAAVLVTGTMGLTGMWLAVIADVGVAILAVLNALRQR